jgi:S1-C subfamily serine protease
VVALVCLMGADLSATDWATVIGPAAKAVVRLEMLRQGHTEPGICSGVVIWADQGYVLTAAHCVDKPPTETLSITVNGRHADLTRINNLLDLAILKTDLRGEKQMALAEKTPDPGTPIAIIGYAFGDPDVFFQFGYVSQTRNAATKLVFLNSDVIGGDSGGPCIDATGKLVAINSRLYSWNSAGLAASAPVETIKEFASSYLPKVVKP